MANIQQIASPVLSDGLALRATANPKRFECGVIKGGVFYRVVQFSYDDLGRLANATMMTVAEEARDVILTTSDPAPPQQANHLILAS